MNRLATLFARRYLLSKKSHSVINVISRVSSFAVAIPVAAMVILLSVFNGFEGLIKQMHNGFDPDIVITPQRGKVLDMEHLQVERVLQIEGVECVSQVVEDNALLEYRGRQYIGVIRGVDSLYSQVVPIEQMVTQGEYKLMLGEVMQAVVGQGVAYHLGLRHTLLDQLRVLAPRKDMGFGSLLPLPTYKDSKIFPAGVFTLDIETDGKYVITPIAFTRELFSYNQRESSKLMVKIGDRRANHRVAAEIQSEIGDQYRVETRDQQNKATYLLMKYEKWGIFIIGIMVLIIASFSIVGSLVMLIIDKRGDMRTVINMGAEVGLVRRIFITEGVFISTIGAVIGLIIGLGLCWIQASFGIIEIPAESALISSYPVEVRWEDMVWIVVAFFAISYIITVLTVREMIPKSQIRV